MNVETMHSPTPEFRDFLEGQVTHAYRRVRSLRRYRSIAVVVAALAVGTSAGLASAQIRDNAQRDSILLAAKAELALVAMRRELAQAQLTDINAKVKAGMLSGAALERARSEVTRMDAMTARAKLNVDEVEATAQPPRDDLAAPLVDGKDFVAQRLQMELISAMGRISDAEAARADADRRIRAGAETGLALLDAELELTRARAAAALLMQRLRLRQNFLAHKVAAGELSSGLQDAQVRHDVMVAQEGLRVARERLSYVKKQRTLGAASELDELKAEVEFRERELELTLLARQLGRLKGASPGGPER